MTSGSTALGQVSSSFARWIASRTGVYHAYSPRWLPGTADDMPVCGAELPRDRLGLSAGPPTGRQVCQACARAVGFRRRPRQAAQMAARYGRSTGAVEELVVALEERVRALEAHAGLRARRPRGRPRGRPSTAEGGPGRPGGSEEASVPDGMDATDAGLAEDVG